MDIIIITIFLLPLIVLFVSYSIGQKKRKVFESKLLEANQEIQNVKNERDDLLKKYAPVIDKELQTTFSGAMLLIALAIHK